MSGHDTAQFPSTETPPSQLPPTTRTTWTRWLGIPALIGAALFGYAVTDGMFNLGKPSWQEFRPPNGGYSVNMPGKPTRREQTMRVEGIDLKQVAYMVENKDAAYGVATMTLPEFGNLNAEEIQMMLDGSVDGMVQTTGATLSSQVKISLNGYPGREIVAIRAPKGKDPAAVINARVYLVRDTQYVIMLVRSGENRGGKITPDKLYQSFRLDNP